MWVSSRGNKLNNTFVFSFIHFFVQQFVAVIYRLALIQKPSIIQNTETMLYWTSLFCRETLGKLFNFCWRRTRFLQRKWIILPFVLTVVMQICSVVSRFSECNFGIEIGPVTCICQAFNSFWYEDSEIFS